MATCEQARWRRVQGKLGLQVFCVAGEVPSHCTLQPAGAWLISCGCSSVHLGAMGRETNIF